MEKLINKTIRKEDLNRYVGNCEIPVKNTMGGKPSITFMSESHTFIYNSEEERDADFNTIFQML